MKKRVFVFVLLLALLFTACGSAVDNESPAPASTADTASDVLQFDAVARNEAVMPRASVADAEFAEEADFAPAEAPSDNFLFPTLTPSQAGDRRLVYTVSMTLQTLDFLPGMRLLLNEVGGADGYLVSADIRGNDMRTATRTAQNAVFHFRLPTEALPEFLVMIENNYNILALRQDMQERTAQYQGNAWGLNDLREQESHLLELIENATEDEQAALSAELRDVRGMIRELEASQAAIMSDVVYSTLEVHLMEVFLLEDIGINAELIFAIAGIALVIIVLVGWLSMKKRRPSKETTI